MANVKSKIPTYLSLWTNVFGSVMLFDPEEQLHGAPNVQLFNVAASTPTAVDGKYFPSSFREVRDPERVEAAASVYGKWKYAHAEEIQRLKAQQAQEQAAQAAQLERRRNQAIELHRAYLEERGATRISVRRATKVHRVTHCWNCRQDLDNAIDIECTTCDWIICSRCGAFGAGYELAAIPPH